MIHGSDEYILPKIAERDLRRFCNLRSTSSDLGLKLPLHKVLPFFLSLVLPVSLFSMHYSRQNYDMRGFCSVIYVLQTSVVVLLVLPWNIWQWHVWDLIKDWKIHCDLHYIESIFYPFAWTIIKIGATSSFHFIMPRSNSGIRLF